MNKKAKMVGIFLALLLVGAFGYRFGQMNTGGAEHAEHAGEAGHKEEGKGEAGHKEEGKGEAKDHEGEKGHQEEHAGEEGHDEHGAAAVTMSADKQRQNGVVVAAAKLQRMVGAVRATGKVEVNADRIAHVAPRIPGKVVSVRASLGDSVSAGQALATLDSVEIGEAVSQYRQSKTRLALAQANMDRVKALVEKKIAARKDILQAETEYRTAQTQLAADEERLSLFGVSLAEVKGGAKRPLLPVRSPIAGTVTEKHAIVGELSDPSKSLYTVADLSSVWVLVDINEKDLAKDHKGQGAVVTVGAFPDLRLKGRITYIADLVDESTRTVKARVEVANPARRLKPEMFATAEIAVAADAPPVLAVPEEALQDLDGKKVLFVAEEGDRFEARQVQPGRSAGGLVEILSGLKEGDRFAAKGAFILKSEVKKGEMVDEHGHGK